MAETDVRISLAGAPLQRARHVCAFFNSADEAYGILLPFIREGLEHHERGFHIVDPNLRRAHLERLIRAGIDADAAQRTDQLEVRAWQDAYLREDHFDQYAMLALVQEVLDGGKAKGFGLTRLIAQMEWALLDLPGVDDLLEYEVRVNFLLPRYDDPVI